MTEVFQHTLYSAALYRRGPVLTSDRKVNPKADFRRTGDPFGIQVSRPVDQSLGAYIISSDRSASLLGKPVATYLFGTELRYYTTVGGSVYTSSSVRALARLLGQVTLQRARPGRALVLRAGPSRRNRGPGNSIDSGPLRAEPRRHNHLATRPAFGLPRRRRAYRRPPPAAAARRHHRRDGGISGARTAWASRAARIRGSSRRCPNIRRTGGTTSPSPDGTMPSTRARWRQPIG